MNFIEAHREFNFVEMNSLSDLDKQYKFLAKKRHPDVGGSSSSFQKLISAKEFLENYIKIYKTTSYRTEKETFLNNSAYQYRKHTNEKPSFYDCDPFIQKTSFLIYLMYFFCFLGKIKVKKINGFTFMFIKDIKIILTAKDAENKEYSIRLGNMKRVSFSNKKNKVEIYPNIFIWFI